MEHGAPRACGDDPVRTLVSFTRVMVLPAYAGMIPGVGLFGDLELACSPRMRG